MINAMILILRLLTFFTWMGMFLFEHPTVFIYRNYFSSPVSSHVTDFNTRNKIFTAKLLSQNSMYPNISKCNAKSCTCCNHLICRSTIISSVNHRQFSVVNNSDLD